MKYTISGFSQKGMCDLRLSADDVNILRWFCDFRNSGKMVKEYCAEENCFFYWVKYSGLIESLPYLFYDCKSEETRKKKLQRILNGNLSKVLKKKVIKKSTGTYTFFATIDEQMEKLLGYATGTEMSSVVKHIVMELSSATGTSDTNAHWNESFQPKDSSINDSSINNIDKTANNKKPVYMDLTFIEDYIDTVKITQDQYDKLVKDYGVNIVNNTIRNLDNYIVNKKPKYKDHNRVLRTWLSKNNNQNGKEHLKRKEIPSFNVNTNYKASTNIDEGYGF